MTKGQEKILHQRSITSAWIRLELKHQIDQAKARSINRRMLSLAKLGSDQIAGEICSLVIQVADETNLQEKRRPDQTEIN
jgi:hypothetical protein